MLLASIGLGFAQIVAASHAASLQRGYRWTASARDETLPPLTGVAGRLERALRNFLETFPMFACLVLMVQITGTQSGWSEWGTILYVAARVVYVLLYAFGVFLVRSLVWNVATTGMVFLVVSLLRG